MTYKAETIREWLDAIRDDSDGLTKWEQEFVDSVAKQFETRGSISDRQEEILERIYAEKTP